MSYALEPAIDQAKPAPEFSPRSSNSPSIPLRQKPRHQCRPRNAPSDEEVLRHYLRRVDPEVAASFTEEQRQAIKVMLGARGVIRHAVEIRHSIPMGRKRFYTVLLMGRERRPLHRLRGEGALSRPLNLAVYAGLAAVVSAPVLGLLLAFAR